MMAQTERELAQRWPLIMATCMGIISSSFVLPYYSIGALLTPVTEEFGWSRAQFQAAILFSSGLGALTSPIVGWLNDKYGPRRIALPSMIGLSLGFADGLPDSGRFVDAVSCLRHDGTAGRRHDTCHLDARHRDQLLQTTRFGAGLGADRNRHLRVGRAALHRMADRSIWLARRVRGLALVPIARLAHAVLPVQAAQIRTRSQPRHEPEASAALESGLTLGEAVRGYRFWVLLLSILFAYQGFSGIGPNLLPSLTDDGFSREQAASVQSVFGLSIIIGRVVVGYLVDRLWAPGWRPSVWRSPPQARRCSMAHKALRPPRWPRF